MSVRVSVSDSAEVYVHVPTGVHARAYVYTRVSMYVPCMRARLYASVSVSMHE